MVGFKYLKSTLAPVRGLRVGYRWEDKSPVMGPQPPLSPEVLTQARQSCWGPVGGRRVEAGGLRPRGRA